MASLLLSMLSILNEVVKIKNKSRDRFIGVIRLHLSLFVLAIAL